MTITFNTPVTQNSLTKKRLIGFAASIIEKRIVCHYEVGYLQAGSFVKVKEETRTFTEETTPSFNNFIQNCPAAAQLRQQTEIYETTLAEPGTVD